MKNFILNRFKKKSMATQPKRPTLASYAYQLRRNLLQRQNIDQLLKLEQEHRDFMELQPKTGFKNAVDHSECFAYHFLTQVKILNPAFTRSIEQDEQAQSGQGVFQDLEKLVGRVQDIWFPNMETRPKARWLKRFSVRKLAHYSLTKDEIAFSLIFDSAEAPAEILHYLAYHELLHRHVGVKIKNGKRMAHTGSFKSKERLFPGFEDMDAKIGQYLAFGSKPKR